MLFTKCGSNHEYDKYLSFPLGTSKDLKKEDGTGKLLILWPNLRASFSFKKQPLATNTNSRTTAKALAIDSTFFQGPQLKSELYYLTNYFKSILVPSD